LGRWQLHRNIVLWFSAMGWGATSLLMVPDATVHNVLMMAVLTGVMGQAAMSNAANDMRANIIGMTSAVLLSSAQLSTVFGESTFQITAMLFLYNAVLLINTRNAHVAMRASIRLRLSNAALARANAKIALRAEQANRDKSEFLAAASHDLRQPVHALLLLIEAYRQEEPSAINHPLMRHMTQAGQSINSMFNALMELSRLESGSEKLNFTEFELRKLWQDVIEDSQPEAQAKGLGLRSFLPVSLAATRVRTDYLLLKRILVNLMSNALRYTQHGGVLLALRRGHADLNGVTSECLWIEVWDTGIGIAQADQTRIFDPYVQMANRERDRSKGLGLGLAIVRHASELLGLHITIHSVPGRGTRFRLELPNKLIDQRNLNHAPIYIEPAPVNSVVQVNSWLTGRRVLLVDDCYVRRNSGLITP
jgi:signal transduction histidine kinase